MKTNYQTNLNTEKTPFSLIRFLGEIDWSLGRIIATILHTLLALLIFISAILFSIMTFSLAFEHGESLYDISSLEIIFTIFFISLIKRYIAYTKQTTISWWRKISTPFFWLGKFILLTWFIFSLFAFNDAIYNSNTLKHILIENKNFIQTLSLIFILLSLYIAVPSKKNRKIMDKNNKESSSFASSSEDANSTH